MGQTGQGRASHTSQACLGADSLSRAAMGGGGRVQRFGGDLFVAEGFEKQAQQVLGLGLRQPDRF